MTLREDSGCVTGGNIEPTVNDLYVCVGFTVKGTIIGHGWTLDEAIADCDAKSDALRARAAGQTEGERG